MTPLLALLMRTDIYLVLSPKTTLRRNSSWTLEMHRSKKKAKTMTLLWRVWSIPCVRYVRSKFRGYFGLM